MSGPLEETQKNLGYDDFKMVPGEKNITIITKTMVLCLQCKDGKLEIISGKPYTNLQVALVDHSNCIIEAETFLVQLLDEVPKK